MRSVGIHVGAAGRVSRSARSSSTVDMKKEEGKETGAA